MIYIVFSYTIIHEFNYYTNTDNIIQYSVLILYPVLMSMSKVVNCLGMIGCGGCAWMCPLLYLSVYSPQCLGGTCPASSRSANKAFLADKVNGLYSLEDI